MNKVAGMRSYPNYLVRRREAAALSAELAQSSILTYWLIDPLDGTQNFIDRDGEFSILIAFVRRREEQADF